MENIRLLWSRFVREDGTVNYRNPLESKIIHKYPISVAPDPSGAEQNTPNIRFTDALLYLQPRGATHLYSITGETFDSYGVALLGTIIL